MLRRATGSRRRWLLIIGCVLVCLAVSVAITASINPAERTVMTVTAPAQSVMSVLVPLIGVLSVADLRRLPGRPDVLSVLVASVLVAAVVALVGQLAAVVPVLVASTAPGRWAHLFALTIGCVLVQCVAVLTGTGFGGLFRSRALAFIATVVIPLALWWLLGLTHGLEAGRGWLTPYESARRLLADAMTPATWLQFCVMVLVWTGGLNALGARRLRRAASASDGPATR
ncbi:hypothetical protein GCM10022236_47020 [Microlunatus ginsengisoli]|uniref:ABC transporter permease n=1 Tax=Microlunatus ginsengisoli TaxID=363863 RepID=A0ABP7AT86_9ACTN